MPSDFTTMTQIGAVFGVNSHVVGRKLKDLALRTSKGKPNSEAFRLGLVDQRWTADHENYMWAWHFEKTVSLLKQAGFDKEADERKGNAIKRDTTTRGCFDGPTFGPLTKNVGRRLTRKNCFERN